jgi:hypothetical protein
MSTIIQHKRGTATQWTTSNPLLLAGEMGWESDTNKFKIGDGTLLWNALSYASSAGGGGTNFTGAGTSITGVQSALGVTLPISTASGATASGAITIGTGTTSNSSLTTGSVTINTGNSASAGGNSGAITIKTGNGSGASGNSGNLNIDVGSKSGGGTTGTINIGNVDSTTIFLGTVSGITKTMVGLGSVDNTTDIGKPVSTAQQTALNAKANNSDLDGKVNKINPIFTSGIATGLYGITGSTVQDFEIKTTSIVSTSTKSIIIQTGNGVYAGAGTGSSGAITIDTGARQNTGTAGTISIGTSYSPTINIGNASSTTTFLGTVSGITKTMVGLGSVDNTADTAKPVSTYQQNALNLKADKDNAVFTGTIPSITGSTAGSVKYDTDLVNRAYVDSQIINPTSRVSVKCATTGALGTSNNLVGGTITTTYANGTAGVGATLTIATSTNWTAVTIDGYSFVVGDRILIKNQGGTSSNLQNGIYTVTTVGAVGTTTSFVFTRATDSDLAAENFEKHSVYVENGSVGSDQADKTFTNIINGDIVMGTTPITYTFTSGFAVSVSGARRIPYTNSNRGFAYTAESTLPGQVLKNGFPAPGATNIGWAEPIPFDVRTGKIASSDWAAVPSPAGEAVVTFDTPFPTGVVPNITFTPISTGTDLIIVTLKAVPTHNGFTAVARRLQASATVTTAGSTQISRTAADLISTTAPTTYWTAVQGTRLIGTPNDTNDGRTDYGTVA